MKELRETRDRLAEALEELQAEPVVRAYPGNADVRRCAWSDPVTNQKVVVHLWGLPESTEDSRLGEGWSFRKCVVCGKPDERWLQRQYDQMQRLEKGPDGHEEPEGA